MSTAGPVASRISSIPKFQSYRQWRTADTRMASRVYGPAIAREQLSHNRLTAQAHRSQEFISRNALAFHSFPQGFGAKHKLRRCLGEVERNLPNHKGCKEMSRMVLRCRGNSTQVVNHAKGQPLFSSTVGL